MPDTADANIVAYRASYSYDSHLLGHMIPPKHTETENSPASNGGYSSGGIDSYSLKGFVEQNRLEAISARDSPESSLEEMTPGTFFEQGDLTHEKNVVELEDFNMKCYTKTKAELVSLAFSMYRTMGLIHEFVDEKKEEEEGLKRKSDEKASRVGVDGHVLHRYLVAIINTSVEDVPYHNCYHYFRYDIIFFPSNRRDPRVVSPFDKRTMRGR